MNENWFVKIEEYLSGKMSREEKLLFESEIASSEELTSLVNIYRGIETEMQKDEKSTGQEILLKNSLAKLTATYFKIDSRHEEGPLKTSEVNEPVSKPMEVPQPPDFQAGTAPVRNIKTWKSLAFAASILGVISLGIIWYLQQEKDEARIVQTQVKEDSTYRIQQKDTINYGKTKPEQNQGKPPQPATRDDKLGLREREILYAANFEADAVPRDKAGPLQEVYGYYESGEYKDALNAFRNVRTDVVSRGDPGDKKLLQFNIDYYKGLSYMGNNEVQKSIPSLENAVRKSPDNFLQNKARWYLSLAYLKTGEIKKSKDILRQILSHDQDGTYKRKATELLASLEKNN